MIDTICNSNDCVILANQIVNANQHNNNVPTSDNKDNYLFMWDFVGNSLLWVNSKTRLIKQQLDGYIAPVTKTPIALVDAPTISWNMLSGYNAYVTLTANRSLSITNVQPGDYGTIKIIQGGAGNNTLTPPAGSKVGSNGNGVLELSPAAGDYDIATFYCDELGVLNFNISNDFT